MHSDHCDALFAMPLRVQVGLNLNFCLCCSLTIVARTIVPANVASVGIGLGPNVVVVAVIVGELE